MEFFPRTADFGKMNKPKLLYYSVQDFMRASIDLMHAHFDVLTLPDPTHDTVDILKNIQLLTAPMGYVVDKEKINRCPRLKIIGTPTTGTVHIDADYATTKDITICSLGNHQEFLSTLTATAELTWGLLLTVVRRIPWAHASVCQGHWNARVFGKQTRKMLSRMSLGIVGLGRLGTMVAEYGRAFNMKVHYYDPHVQASDYIKVGTLHDLAQASDILTIHAQLTKDTENLIDRDIIFALSKGAYIVNTARGGILDEDALLDALNSGHIAGAGLDMLAGEHLPGFKQAMQDHPLIQYACQHENLVITPKIGGSTVDSWEEAERFIIDEMLDAWERKETL